MFRQDNNIKINLKVLRFYGGDSVPEGKKKTTYKSYVQTG